MLQPLMHAIWLCTVVRHAHAGGLWESGNATAHEDFYTQALQQWRMSGSPAGSKPKFKWAHLNWKNPRFWYGWCSLAAC